MTPTQVDWGPHLNQMLYVLVPAATGLILTLFGYITWLVKRKMDASTALDQNALVQSISRQAAFKAEEDAARVIDHGGRPLPGAKKMDIAVAFVMDKLPDMSHLDAVDNVQAAVGAIPTIGASAKTEVVK